MEPHGGKIDRELIICKRFYLFIYKDIIQCAAHSKSLLSRPEMQKGGEGEAMPRSNYLG